MNAAVRAVVRSNLFLVALLRDGSLKFIHLLFFSLSYRFGIYLGCKVYFIKEGYQGMVDGGKHIVGMEPLQIRHFTSYFQS